MLNKRTFKDQVTKDFFLTFKNVLKTTHFPLNRKLENKYNIKYFENNDYMQHP